MERMTKQQTTLSAIAAIMGVNAATIAGNAWAQGALEEIVVTATRRETNVQDTPLAITALSSEMMESQNIENLEDITAVVPNVLLYGWGGNEWRVDQHARCSWCWCVR
jgi:iron complex outermembrane recepter protein